MIVVDVVIPTNTMDEQIRAITQNSIYSLRSCEPNNVKFNVVVCEQNKDAQDYEQVDLTLHYDFPFNFNKVLNYGAQHCNNKYIMFVNNDIMYCRGFIMPLLSAAMMGYRSLSPTDPHHDKPDERPYVEGYGIDLELKGWFILCDRAMYEQIGGFDERVDFYWSDNLYKEQLKSVGIKHARVTNSFAVHFGRSTLRKHDRQKRIELTDGQGEKFLELTGKKR